jgi:dolichyl-phosphate-mannose-protein mannosyltransferase
MSRLGRYVERIRRVPVALVAVIASALLLRAFLVPLNAYLTNGYQDENDWKHWMTAIHQHGVLNVFRTSDTDYVGYHWVLWLLTLVYDAVGGPYSETSRSLHVLIKMPSLVFDVALIAIVYEATALLAQELDAVHVPRLALIGAAVIAFQPAVVYDSAIWAQTDAAITAAMLAALLLVASGRHEWGWGVWMLGFLLKPQPVLVVPVLVVLTFRLGGPLALARSWIVAGIVFVLVLSPWFLHGDGMRIERIYRQLFFADYGRLSSAAWNFWWFIDALAHRPGPTEHVMGLPLIKWRYLGGLLSLASAAVACGWLWSRTTLRGALVAGSYLAFAFYVVPVSTHDRYLYPFLGLMLPVVVLERRWLPLYAGASLTLMLNMFFSAPPVQSWAGRWIDSPLSYVVAGANVAMFAAFTAVLLPGAVRNAGALTLRLWRRTPARVPAAA